MCGIFGYIGNKSAAPILIKGLKDLEYRGYDSVGLALLGNKINISKCTGTVESLKLDIEEFKTEKIGIAHTRWATHGKVTKDNAHPHQSQDGKIVVIHNGIIENEKRIRDLLIKEGFILKSETDSELIAHLISKAYKLNISPLECVQEVLKYLTGTWGLCVIFEDEDCIICARNGSSIALGLGNNENFISSDPYALSEYTDKIIYLEDGEVALITKNNIEVTSESGDQIEPKITIFSEEWSDSSLIEYPHHMLKEINEQPESIRRCIAGRIIIESGDCKLNGLELTDSELKDSTHITLIGCGTALNACQVGSLIITELADIVTNAYEASEFATNNMIIDNQGLYFVVTQSGETADILSAIKYIKNKGGDVRGIVNVVGSSVARECGKGVYLYSGQEKSVASTKVFSNMVTALIMLGIQIGRARNLNEEVAKILLADLIEVPDIIEKYLKRNIDFSEVIAAINKSKQVIFLGRGLSAPIAREGALKLMEITYIPCLGYSAGAMKHGPLALLEENSPVIIIAPKDEHREKLISNLLECKSRGAKIIIIHQEGDDEITQYADISISVPCTGRLLSPLMTVIPLHLISYYTGLKLGKNIDKPRNLAKSVTVG